MACDGDNERGFDHGPRLSDEDYDRKIIELHAGLPPAPTRDQQQETLRRELELAIDHRLGRDFPLERRAALWEVKQGVERKRGRLMITYLWRKLSGKSLAADAPGLARFVVDEYASVLSKAELEGFFGADEVRQPALPVDEEPPK